MYTIIICRVYTPRIWDCKSQSRMCKLKQITANNIEYSDIENTIKYKETSAHIDDNGLTTILTINNST